MPDVYHTTIQDHGRVVIPAGVPDAVKRFQAAVRRHVPAGVSLADELIVERRATDE